MTFCTGFGHLLKGLAQIAISFENDRTKYMEWTLGHRLNLKDRWQSSDLAMPDIRLYFHREVYHIPYMDRACLEGLDSDSCVREPPSERHSHHAFLVCCTKGYYAPQAPGLSARTPITILSQRHPVSSRNNSGLPLLWCSWALYSRPRRPYSSNLSHRRPRLRIE